MDIQNMFAIFFIITISIILWIKRKNLDIHKIFFPFLYVITLKTKLGIKLMDKIAKKCPKSINFISQAGIYIGFAGMFLISFELIRNVIKIFTQPGALPGVGLVLPIPIKGAFYVPFFYWIISIFILATIHEFAHGIVAKLHNVKVKSSGIGFLSIILPIIPLAFVEPDEKELVKKSSKKQLAVFAAGPLANILFAFIILGFSLLITNPVAANVIDYDGVLITDLVKEYNTSFPAETAGVTENELITKIDGTEITYITNFTSLLENKKPGDRITLVTNRSAYDILLVESPEDKEKAYLGVYVKQSTKIKESFKEKYGTFLPSVILWFIGLLFWLYVLNLGIGLFNLVPIGPVDGGRMAHTVLTKYFKKIGIKIWKTISVIFIILILCNIIYAFIR